VVRESRPEVSRGKQFQLKTTEVETEMCPSQKQTEKGRRAFDRKRIRATVDCVSGFEGGQRDGGNEGTGEGRRARKRETSDLGRGENCGRALITSGILDEWPGYNRTLKEAGEGERVFKRC